MVTAHLPEISSLCKTAIVSFLVDKETVLKLWNLSSDTRKITKMVMEDTHIILREYSQNALKINGWVKPTRSQKYIYSVEQMEKGVENYKLETEEQLDRVVALNGEIRCSDLMFQPKEPPQFDYLQRLSVDSLNCDYYLRCFFHRVSDLSLDKLSDAHMKDIVTRFGRTKNVSIKNSSLPALDLRRVNFTSVSFYDVSFTGEVKLPSCFDSLRLFSCENLHFLKYDKVTKVVLAWKNLKDLPDLKEYLRGVKLVNIWDIPVSEYINSLPITLRKLDGFIKLDSENIDPAVMKEKCPYLIDIMTWVPIEMAQMLNLRSITPKISETEEVFTFRPREIEISEENAKELIKHPELFQEVQSIWIVVEMFNFDILPTGLKKLQLCGFSTSEESLESFRKNNWKFEEALLDLTCLKEHVTRKILDSLEKVSSVLINYRSEDLIEEYPQFRFLTE